MSSQHTQNEDERARFEHMQSKARKELMASAPTTPTTRAEALVLLERMGFQIATKRVLMQDAPLIQVDDTPTSLSAFRGKVILLHLWATWCTNCRGELPSMDRFYRQGMTDDIALVPVGIVNPPRETKRSIRNYVASKGYAFPPYVDVTGDVSSFYNPGAVPVTYIIDPSGEILALARGTFEWNAPAFIQALQALVNKN